MSPINSISVAVRDAGWGKSQSIQGAVENSPTGVPKNISVVYKVETANTVQ